MKSLKRTVIGAVLSLLGSIWGLAALLVGAAYMENVSEWPTAQGRYVTAILRSGMMPPLAIGGVLLLLGLLVTGIEYFKKED